MMPERRPASTPTRIAMWIIWQMTNAPSPRTTPGAPGAGPLAGVKILDLTAVLMGPLATHILASLGAEVTKIEAPEGDNIRDIGAKRHAGMGHIFMQVNQGKKSVVLDLKTQQGRQAVVQLAQQHDVLITNVRPAAMKRLGLDYETVKLACPRLIYVSCVGYGQTGPYAARPAYDDLIQGAVGIPWLMQQYGTPEPCYAPVTLADRVTGLHAVYAVTAALYAREKTGVGQHVEVPMFEALAQFVLGDHIAGHSFTPALGAAGYQRLLTPNRKPYKTKDGYLCVLIYNDKHWKSFFNAVGDPQRMELDRRFANQGQRSNHIDAVYAYVVEALQHRSTADWKLLLDKADIPYAQINSPEELVKDPHLNAVGFFVESQHPTEGAIRTMRTPTRWSGTPTAGLSPYPELGEHTEQVLQAAALVQNEP